MWFTSVIKNDVYGTVSICSVWQYGDGGARRWQKTLVLGDGWRRERSVVSRNLINEYIIIIMFF